MKLHYSQTKKLSYLIKLVFYYLMKLHYSQTELENILLSGIVLLPYEITLFSNNTTNLLAVY